MDTRADEHAFALSPHFLVLACTRVLKRRERGERLRGRQGERGVSTTTRLRFSAPGEAALGFGRETPGPRAPRGPPAGRSQVAVRVPQLGIKGCGRFCSLGRSPSPASFVGQGAVPQRRGRAGWGYASPSGRPKAVSAKRRFGSAAAPWALGAASVR